MIDPNPNDDVVRRNIKRELACKLNTDDQLRICNTMVVKKRELRELEADLVREKKKRQEQIDDLEDEVRRMETDLDRGAEDRTVPCNDVFRRADDGTGWIVTVRLDTYDEVERKAASAHETQRYLPHLDVGPSSGSVLDDARAQQAAAAQRSAAPAEDASSDVPSDDVPADEGDTAADGDDAGDADVSETTPEKKAKPEKFDAELLAAGKCALRFEGGAGCKLEVGHEGLHDHGAHKWKARRPKVEQTEPATEASEGA